MHQLLLSLLGLPDLFFKMYFYSFCEYVGLVCNDICVFETVPLIMNVFNRGL